jgi:hypothetical protein
MNSFTQQYNPEDNSEHHVQHEVVRNDLQDANERARLSPSGEHSDVNSTSDDSNADDEERVSSGRVR